MSVSFADLGVAIIGYGAIADLHAAALTHLGARIVGAAGPNEIELAEFAARHGIARTMTNSTDLVIDAAVDAVVVATPSQLHAAQAALALESGRHVLVEIPVALSLEDAERVTALAAATGRILAVCHTLRYSESFIRARKLLEDRKIQPRHVVARSLLRRRENVGWTGRRRSWTDNLLWHHGGHTIDAVLLLLGADSVASVAACGPESEGTTLPMDYSIQLRSADGALGTIALSYNSLIAANDFLVIGESESLLLTGVSLVASSGTIFEGEPAALQKQAIVNQDRDFLESIVAGRVPASAAELILPAVRVIAEVEKRCLEGSMSLSALGAAARFGSPGQ